MLVTHEPGPRRRALPRVSVEAFCSEHTDERERHAMILDFSEHGLRLQRPIGGPRTRCLQLEFEIPEIDEVVWAQGEVCFDQVWQVPAVDGSKLSGILRTSGVHIVSAADRHQRLLREYVNDTWLQRQRIDVEQHLADTEWFYRSSRYLRC